MASFKDIGAYQEAGGPDIGAYESEEAAPAGDIVVLRRRREEE